MTWYKVDDKLHSHKKAIKAGDAMALWVMAGSWAADQLSDGFVPDYVVLRMFPAQGEAWAERLVSVGLWKTARHDGDDGWAFHQWDDHQPTRAEVESKRETERERKRRQRRGSTGQFEESARSHAGVPLGQHADTPRDSAPSHTVPSRPDPTRPEEEPSSASRKKPARKLPEDWTPTDTHHAKAAEKGLSLVHEAENFRLHAETHDRKAANWNSAFTMWLNKATPRQPTIPMGRPTQGSWMTPRKAS